MSVLCSFALERVYGYGGMGDIYYITQRPLSSVLDVPIRALLPSVSSVCETLSLIVFLLVR